MNITTDTYPYTEAEAHLRAVAERECQPYFTDWKVREMASPAELDRASAAYQLLRALDDWVHNRLGTPVEARGLMTPEEYAVYGSDPIDHLLNTDS